jgi:hypothetical protein
MRPFGYSGDNIARSMRSVLPCLIVGFLLVAASTVLVYLAPACLGGGKAWIILDPAEEMPIGRGTSIRLDSQQIVIRERLDHDRIDATFRLFNTGETTVQWVGVPGGWGLKTWPEGVPFILEFKGWVNGREVNFTKAQQEHECRHVRETGKVAEVTFPGNTLTTIRIKFHIRPDTHLYYPKFWKWRIGKPVVIRDSTIGLRGFGHASAFSCPGPRWLTENLMVQER